jgi:hypothetical protein
MKTPKHPKKASLTLRIKSRIYRYTGFFLANSEQLEYVTSEEFWKEFSKIAKHPKNDMSMYNIQGLLIGSWQAHHGFTRPWNYGFLRRFTWFGRLWPVRFFYYMKTNLQAIWWDIKK